MLAFICINLAKMGMWLFIFEHEVWKEMYNCSMKTTQEWNAEGRPNVPIGTLYLIMGIVCEVILLDKSHVSTW